MPPVVVTHAGIAAGVGKAFSRVCLFVCALTEKRLDLSMPNLVHVYAIAVVRHALTQGQMVTGQGHTVTKTVNVARLLVTRAATAVVGVNLHVDTTAYVF